MKLEVGQFVRTTKGKIDKIDDYDSTFNCYHLITELKCSGIVEDDVLKASHNIIDLIEVGDYVNGFEVQSVDKNEKTVICYTATFFEDEIETIVTKECFESMSYEVSKC